MLTEKQTLKLSQLAGGTSSSVRCCVLIFFKSKIIIALRYFKYLYKSSYQEKKKGQKHPLGAKADAMIQINNGQC